MKLRINACVLVVPSFTYLMNVMYVTSPGLIRPSKKQKLTFNSALNVIGMFYPVTCWVHLA